jgi:hypothetical protein
MGLLRKLGSIFGGKPEHEGDENAIIFYVRCNACGEVIRVRADRRWDLMQEFDDNDRISGYTLRKDVLGTKCFRMMTVEMSFDRTYGITDKSVQGGTFATADEYRAYQASQEGSGE